MLKHKIKETLRIRAGKRNEYGEEGGGGRPRNEEETRGEREWERERERESKETHSLTY